MNLSAIDIVIIVVYLALSFFSGVFVKKYIRNISDFLIADRSMGLNLGMASLLSSEIGIITFMYMAEAGYRGGFVALMTGFPFFVILILLGKTGFIVRPLLEMKITTIPELFERTFGHGVRFYAGLLMAIGGIINFGVFPGVEAKFINVLTGIPQSSLLLTMIVLLTLVLIYTAFGGMVSVIFTNYVQFILLSLGMVLITVLGTVKIGWPNIVRAVNDNYGAAGTNPFAPGSQFGWSYLVWQTLNVLCVAIAPYMAMRLFSSKDSRTGTQILTWSSVMFLGRVFIPVFWGILALAFLPAKPDDPLQALPLMIAGLIPKGLLGIVVAAMLAASMSTYASYLLSWSAIISQDIIGVAVKRITGRTLASRKQLVVSRLTMAAIIVFIIWWSFFYRSEEMLLFYLMLAANLFLPGTLIAAFFGLYGKKTSWGLLRARTLGAYLAFTFGAFPTVWFFLPSHPPAGKLGALSYAAALVGMILGSVLQNIKSGHNTHLPYFPGRSGGRSGT